ncbi:SIS domain-containing protein [Hyalangium rubrum]|uniref:SIS domain-containing protein n=1 Tax=Hyalangium rubrum TaxID=3103134 RepID=A0ABU5H6J2_9BACT|nr:SIS domain-containing protein [Hyalangium sp. s54d21]MDY7229097.1 SIS domain-containing protein [Hyalangium sp. s54d21]
MNTDTQAVPAMAREATQAAEAARRQIRDYGAAFAELGERLRRRPPRFIVTCARGSSDHAASYGKYLLETTLGRAVASMGPSVASVYNTQDIDLRDALFIAVSQSGRSPDLLRLTERAHAGGALVVGFINNVQSPLFELCDIGLPLCAGPEESVAATKSYLTSGLAFLQLVAHWSQAGALREAVSALPESLEAARALDWWPALEPLVDARSLFVIGRGIGLGAALEMALKFKETSRLHAEAFSTAEVLHGPLALVGPGFPILALAQEDSSAESTRHVVHRLVQLGADVHSVLPVPGSKPLPTVPGVPHAIAPLCQVQSFYMAVHRLAVARKLNPDMPAHLRKVTETV